MDIFLIIFFTAIYTLVIGRVLHILVETRINNGYEPAYFMCFISSVFWPISAFFVGFMVIMSKSQLDLIMKWDKER